MTRDEQIRQTAISEQKGLMESCDWRGGFVSGAKWADKTMIEKACEWLLKGGYFINNNETIEEFSKAMEE